MSMIMGTIEKLEKAPLQSKKFIACLVSNAGSKAIILCMIYRNVSDIIMMSAIIAASFLDIGYVLGQAALDKYVRVTSLQSKD